MILLAISVRFLCTANGTDGAALPAAIVLLIVFTVYHHPQTKKPLIAFSLMARCCAGLGQLRHAWRVPQKSGGVRKANHLGRACFTVR